MNAQTSHVISEHHIWLYEKLKTHFNNMETRNDAKMVITTYQFSLTILIKEEGGWVKHVLESADIHKKTFRLNLPSSDKNMLKFLRRCLQQEAQSNATVPFFVPIAIQEYEAAGTNGAARSVLERFRILNESFKEKSQETINEALTTCLAAFSDSKLERMGLELKATLTLTDRSNVSQNERLVETIDLRQTCSTCDGWRSTSMAVYECVGCIQKLPQDIPVQHHEWDRIRVFSEPESGSSIDTKLNPF